MMSQYWLDMASVYMAGAVRSRGWVYNIERQQQAEVLEAMAARCVELAEGPEARAEREKAERQSPVPSGSPLRCQVFMVHDSANPTRCRLHREHVLDDTDHLDHHGCRASVMVSQVSAEVREAGEVL